MEAGTGKAQEFLADKVGRGSMWRVLGAAHIKVSKAAEQQYLLNSDLFLTPKSRAALVSFAKRAEVGRAWTLPGKVAHGRSVCPLERPADRKQPD